MDAVDLKVLKQARDWMAAGHAVLLYTVVETWGSAPRPVGSLLALREDGLVEGSVSGGCIEDDLLARMPLEDNDDCEVLTYHISPDESARFGLPCGGTLRLVREPLRKIGWIDELLRRCADHQHGVRRLDLASGRVELEPADDRKGLQFDGKTLCAPFGPAWRILLIGAGLLSRYIAELALNVGFEVYVCDPREGLVFEWGALNVRFMPGAPEDALRALQPDAHTAVVALTHEPRLDDCALLVALRSRAFYVGALGSKAHNEQRKARLLAQGVPESALARLHGPVGLPIGSRTPPEIALSLMAEVVALKNGALQSSQRTARCA